MFMFVSSSFPITLLGFALWSNDIQAYAIDLNATYGQRTFSMLCNRSGDTLSNLKTSVVINNYSGNNGEKGTFPITHIYGII